MIFFRRKEPPTPPEPSEAQRIAQALLEEAKQRTSDMDKVVHELRRQAEQVNRRLA